MDFKIITEKRKVPPRVVLYAPEGVGKTTFGTQTPAPLFIATERGTDHFDIPRVNVTSYIEIKKVLAFLLESKDYQSVVIDTIDWMEKLIEKHICDIHSVESIEDKKAFPYAAGYRMVQEEVEKVLSFLDNLVNKGIGVYLLAHAKIDTFNDPEVDEPLNRWTLKCHKRTAPLYKEWSDAVLFANHDKMVIDGKAKGGYSRMVYTSHTAARDAKNRYNMPEELELNYSNLEKYFKGEK